MPNPFAARRTARRPMRARTLEHTPPVNLDQPPSTVDDGPIDLDDAPIDLDDDMPELAAERIEWIGQDRERAERAMADENERGDKARSTVVDAATAVLGG